MLKKFLFSLVCSVIALFAVANQTYAVSLGGDKVNVAVVLDTPGGMFSEPEKVYETIKESLDNIFKDSDKYHILPIGDTDAYVQIYREEHDLSASMDTGYVTVDRRDLSLKKENINEICKHFDADYVIYTRVTSSAPRVSVGFMSAGQKVNVTLDFRVWSDKKAISSIQNAL